MPDVTPDPNQQQQQQQPTPSPDQQPTAQNPDAAPQVNMPAGAPPSLGQSQPQMPMLAKQPEQNQPHPVSRIFDGILKTMTGGPVTYIDANGQKQVAPQSRGTMAKSIVAAALAGLLTPTQYREGAFGSKVEDFGATAAGAAQAGKGVMEAARNRPQQMSDDEQARRLMAITSNANLIKNMSASTLQGHAALQSMVDSSAPLLSSVKEYEKTRTANQPSALIGENLSKEEAEAKMNGHFTEWKAIPTGTESVLNPQTHQTEEHPVYSIVNPNVNVPLNEEAVNILASVNPSFKGAWQATNGKVEVPLSIAVSTQHLVNEAHVVQAFADSPELQSAFPGMKQANVAAALRGPNGKSLATALDATRDAIAAGSPTYLTLNALRTAPNGGVLLNALGLSPDAVNSYIQKQSNAAKAADKLAAEGGIGDKAPAPPQMVSAVIAEAKKLPPEDANAILAGINPQGMTVGELEKLKDKVLTTVQQNKVEDFNKLKETGDPVQAAKTASNIIEGDVDSLVHSTTLRGQSRQVTLNAIHDEAVKRGLDPVNYSEQALEAKGNMMRDFMSNKKGSTGSQLSSFDAFLGHEGAALDTLDKLKNKTLGLSNSPVWNTAMDSVGKQLTNDPDWKAFKTSLLPVQNEINNFLSGGFAVQAHEQALMQQVLDPHETPSRVDSALRQLAETADIRLGAMGRRYLDVMGTTYSHLISDDAQRTLRRVGIQSKAVPLSVSLPKGWKNGQGQPLTNPTIAKSFVQAAGGNNTRAAEIAKDNGWTGF
jgi:hypothetical protein